MIKLNEANKSVEIENLTVADEKMYSFLVDKEEKEYDEWAKKIMSVGTVGLRQMVLFENMDFVQRGFDKFLVDAQKSFDGQQEQLDSKIASYFDDTKNDSMISKFKIFIADNSANFDSDNPTSLLGKFKASLVEERNTMNSNFEKYFSLDRTDSVISKFQNTLKENHVAFDMENPKGILGAFKIFLDEKSDEISETLDNTFSEEKAGSVFAKFKAFLDSHEKKFDFNTKDSLFSKFHEFMQKEKNEFNKAFNDNFSMDDTNSSFFRLQESLGKMFDDSRENSPLYVFKKTIEDNFGGDNSKLQRVMNDYLGGDDSKLQKMLDKSFDLDKSGSSFSNLVEKIKANSTLSEDEIRKMLNPNSDDSPIGQLKKNISDEFKQIGGKIREVQESELKDIRDAVVKFEEIEELKSKGTAKGREFENVVYDFMQEVCSYSEDTVSPTGDVSSGSGKVGDLIVDVDGDMNKRIVIECKDKKKQSKMGTHKEIVKALHNRNAKFGIFLFENSELMPREFRNLGNIKITDSYIVTSYDKENLYLSYRLAKIFLRRKNAGEDISEQVIIEIKKIEENLKLVKDIQQKAKNITTAVGSITENSKIVYDSIESGVKRIESSIV